MRATGLCFLLAFGTIAWGGSFALADDAVRTATKPTHAAAHPRKAVRKPPRMAAHPAHATTRRVGKASIYHDHFQGHKTATGETFSQNKLTAASRDLPLGSKATVTNRQNGKSVEVEVNDRGPYVDGRVIDLSKTAAKRIGVDENQGIAPVVVEAKPAE